MPRPKGPPVERTAGAGIPQLFIRANALVRLFVLVGCAPKDTRPPERIIETKEIRVPVPVRVEPPAELARTFQPPALPEFKPAGSPGIVIGLTEAGAKAFERFISAWNRRDQAWRAWAASPAAAGHEKAGGP